MKNQGVVPLDINVQNIPNSRYPVPLNTEFIGDFFFTLFAVVYLGISHLGDHEESGTILRTSTAQLTNLIFNGIFLHTFCIRQYVYLLHV